jgi:acid phosphatase
MRETGVVRSVLVTLAATMIVGCGATTTARPPARVSPPASAAAVRHTHENLNAVLWMQTAVEYRASALQAYRTAKLALDAALADTRETAALEQTSDPSHLAPAVVLDIDETVLDNSAFQARQVADGAPYSESAWNAWCLEERAGAIPGAIEFLTYAHQRGVTPIYITNRDASVEEATRHVLARLGAPLETATDVVLARHEQGWDGSDKGSRRSFVAKSYRVVLLVGDNFEDFVSVPQALKSMAGRDEMYERYAEYFGTRWIVLPNPTYGSWEQAITSGAPPTDTSAVLARKYAALRLAR